MSSNDNDANEPANEQTIRRIKLKQLAEAGVFSSLGAGEQSILKRLRTSTRCEQGQHERCTDAGECECECHQTAPPTPDLNADEWRVDSESTREDGEATIKCGMEWIGQVKRKYAARIVADHNRYRALAETVRHVALNLHSLSGPNSGLLGSTLRELRDELHAALTTPATQPAAGEE